jgi:predicted phosphohydrolase
LTAHVTALHAAAADAVLVTGDFATAASLPRWLRAYRRMADRPLYFILGNHDFWGGRVAEVREEVRRLSAVTDGIVYLTAADPVTLVPGVALVGHDGWYDARAGRWETPRFRMQDWDQVADFPPGASHEGIVAVARALADAAEADLVPKVEAAARDHTTVLVATHVPPWPLPAGGRRHPDGEWIAPWYVARGLGGVLERLAADHPRVAFRVMAGHAHARREGIAIAPNLTCDVGGAQYGSPRIERVLELGERGTGNGERGGDGPLPAPRSPLPV